MSTILLAHLLGEHIHLVLIHGDEAPDLTLHRTQVADRLHHVARPGLACDAAQTRRRGRIHESEGAPFVRSMAAPSATRRCGGGGRGE